MTADAKNIGCQPAPDWRQLWAKSGQGKGNACWHPLWKHLVDASAVSLALANPLSEFGWNRVQTALIVGLHDVGKADAAFQRQVPDLLKQAGAEPDIVKRKEESPASVGFYKLHQGIDVAYFGFNNFNQHSPGMHIQ